jgi:hypothetical protein
MANTLAVSRTALHGVGMTGARKLVTRATRRTLNRSAILCPVDTGLLRATGKMNVGSRGSVVIGQVEYTANYAMAVHEGRRAITIRPKSNDPRARLRFKVGGKWVYAREVHQKARRGRPFLADALREVSQQEGLAFRRIRS